MSVACDVLEKDKVAKVDKSSSNFDSKDNHKQFYKNGFKSNYQDYLGQKNSNQDSQRFTQKIFYPSKRGKNVTYPSPRQMNDNTRDKNENTSPHSGGDFNRSSGTKTSDNQNSGATNNFQNKRNDYNFNSSASNNLRGRGNKNGYRNKYSNQSGFSSVNKSFHKDGSNPPYLRGSGGRNRNFDTKHGQRNQFYNNSKNNYLLKSHSHQTKMSSHKDNGYVEKETSRSQNQSSSRDSLEHLNKKSDQGSNSMSSHSESSRSNNSHDMSLSSNESKLPESKKIISKKNNLKDDVCKSPCIFSDNSKSLDGKTVTNKSYSRNQQHKTNELLVDVDSVLNIESVSSNSTLSRESTSLSNRYEQELSCATKISEKSQTFTLAKKSDNSEVNLSKCKGDNNGKQLNKKEILAREASLGESNKKNPNESIKEVNKNKSNGNVSKQQSGKQSGDSCQNNDKRDKTPNQDNNPKNPKKKKKIKKEPRGYLYTIELRLEDSFDDQAIHMIKQIEMNYEELSEIAWINHDLTKLFSLFIKDMEPVLFGSIVAGTAFRHSDVDIFLICYKGLPTASIPEFVAKHGGILYKGSIFKQVVKIANARVPIVKAIHTSTGKSIDVSFVLDWKEPHFGLINSHLVKFLCSHDPRVRKLIMLVLFWAKHHSFVGKYQMSSFAFILMAVFYLQIVEILPPLYKIIKFEENRNKWPTEFNHDPSFLHNNNKESLESLYVGFFTFFSSVRFDEVVVSVYAGELILGALFESPSMLPPCYAGYWRLVEGGHEKPLVRNEICVQEPFNMSWNTVRGVNDRNIEMLKHGFHNVCSVFSKFSSNRVLPIIHSEYQLPEDKDDSFSWHLPCPPDIEPVIWFRKVLEATRKVFSTILLMVIHEDDDDNKHNDNNYSTFFYSSKCEENPVRLIVSCDIIVACKERDKLLNAYKDTSHSEYEKQVKVSALYAETMKKQKEKSGLYATLYIARNENNGSTEITVNKCHHKRSSSKKKEHENFVSYLKNDNFKHFLALTLQLEYLENTIATPSPSNMSDSKIVTNIKEKLVSSKSETVSPESEISPVKTVTTKN